MSQPHQQRVVAEQKELAERVAKLTAFMAAPEKFKALPFSEQARLRRQLIAMEHYDSILLERIQAFGKA